tara:strand:- start:817 stop:1230 length:414 start_codon:yes stop_codon:yes gene_type:complete
MVNSFKHSPYFVGLEKMLDTLESQSAQKSNYPPYDLIEIEDGKYEIRLAVSGFKEGELAVELDRRILTVTGEQSKDGTDEIVKFHHKGISRKSFTRQFTLGEYIEVSDVAIADGVLSIGLEQRIPEDQLPTKFEIKS